LKVKRLLKLFTLKKEAKAALALAIIIGIYFLGRVIISQVNAPKALSIQVIQDSSLASINPKSKEYGNENLLAIHRTNFDPNTAPIDVLTQQGIPNWLAKRILNYRNRGGKFRTKTDLLRIYDFPDTLYQALSSFILLPDTAAYLKGSSNSKFKQYRSTINKSNAKPCILAFNINKAGIAELEQLNGIGTSRARWILDYRDRLGGFVDKNQFTELVGLDSAANASLNAYAQVFPDDLPIKINLNTATLEELAKHPYLSRREAKAIYNFRIQRGNYLDIDELVRVRVLSEKSVERLRPYFTVE